MASDTTNGRVSDNETAERPVREQLKKASIGGLPTENTENIQDMAASSEDIVKGESTEEPQPRRSLQRKRSFEELEGSEASTKVSSKNHNRKRSRDSTADEEELNNGQRKVSGESARASIDESRRNGTTSGGPAPDSQRATTPDLAPDSKALAAGANAVASPKTKRSRLHSAGIEETSTADESATKQDKSGDGEVSASTTTSTDLPATKIPPTSGFANTSAVSPFGALAESKSPSTEPAQTSSSAFASSGFGALAKSSSSGFGAIGAASGGFGLGGGFATGGKSPLGSLGDNDEKSKDGSTSAFGGALGQKSAFASTSANSGGFGSAASGFGKLAQTSGFASPLGGSGFASLAGGSSGGLSSFASGKLSGSLAAAAKPAKAFGAPADEDDGEGDNDANDNDNENETNVISHDDEKQDERFYAQDLETGEEDEKTDYSCRAKLYSFSAGPGGKKEWRERGLGVLRLNVKHDAGEASSKPQARFLMRADGSHRVVLNTPIKKEIKFGAPNGGPPQGSFLYFMGTIAGSEGLELLQLKMKANFALELHERIVELQEEM